MKTHHLIDFINSSRAVTVLLISIEAGGKGGLRSLSPRDRLLKQANEVGPGREGSDGSSSCVLGEQRKYLTPHKFC